MFLQLITRLFLRMGIRSFDRRIDETTILDGPEVTTESRVDTGLENQMIENDIRGNPKTSSQLENEMNEYGPGCRPEATTGGPRVDTELEDQLSEKDLRPRTWSNLENEIANVWIERDLRMQGCRGCWGCCTTRKCVVSTYLWISVFLAMALLTWAGKCIC